MTDRQWREFRADAIVSNIMQTREEFRQLLGTMLATLSIDRNWDCIITADEPHRSQFVRKWREVIAQWSDQMKEIEIAEEGVFAGAFEEVLRGDKPKGKK